MKQKQGKLEEDRAAIGAILNDIVWMAVRYAHGRSTVAPSTVRRAVKEIKEIYPNFKLKRDDALLRHEPERTGPAEDYLDDLFTM